MKYGNCNFNTLFFFSSCADIISHVAVEITRKNQLINLFNSIPSNLGTKTMKKQWTNIKPITFIRQKKEKNKSVFWFVLSVICVIIQNGEWCTMKKPSSFVLRSGFQNFHSTANKCIVQSCFAGCKRRLSSARKINSGDWQAHYLCLSAGCCLTSMKTTDGNASLISQLVAVLSFVIRLSRSCKEMQKKRKCLKLSQWHANGQPEALAQLRPSCVLFTGRPKKPKETYCPGCFAFSVPKKQTKKQYKINESY